MLSLKTLLLAPLALASASPLVQRQMDIPENWNWHVTDWYAGCHRGCSYSFNITVPTVENQIAGVKAYCSGYESYGVNATYTPCQILEGVNNGVAAKFGPRNTTDGRGPPLAYFSFELAAYEPDDIPAYNFTGSHPTIYNAFVAPLQDFDVTPTQVTTVA